AILICFKSTSMLCSFAISSIALLTTVDVAIPAPQATNTCFMITHLLQMEYSTYLTINLPFEIFPVHLLKTSTYLHPEKSASNAVINLIAHLIHSSLIKTQF